MKLLPALLLVTICYSASAQNFRLQRIVYYNSIDNSKYTGTREFFYPGNRGSDYKHGIVNYDSAVVYYSPNTPKYIYKKRYDGSNRILVDSFSDVTLASYSYYKIIVNNYAYDSIGRVTRHSYLKREHRHSTIANTTNYKYDSSGRLIQTNLTSIDIYGSNKEEYQSDYYYDSSGNNIKILNQVFDTTNQIFENYHKDTFVYNSNNLLTKHTTYWWRDSLWAPNIMQTASYATGSKASESAQYVYNQDSTKFIQTSRTTYKYNNLGDTTEITGYSYNYPNNNPIKTGKRIIKYNSYYQPDTIFYYTSQFSPHNPDTQLYFNRKEVHIYQVHWPTNVSNTIELKNNLKIYPVPANNTLNLTAEIKGPQDVTISISDIHGRVLYTHQELSSLSINKKIPVNKLPNGIYILKLSGHNLNLTRKFSIAR